MESVLRAQVLCATRQWLRPLLQVLLRCGVTWREFADLARTAMVEVATRDFGKRGRATNIARTAVLTGLSRRDVRRLREKLEESPDAWTGHVTKASLALTTWHQDPRFATPDGQPRRLAPSGAGASFTELLKACGAGDVPTTTLLKELRDAGALREHVDGSLEALARNYIPQGMDANLVRLWGTVIADVATTYRHNLTRCPDEPARFERSAVNAAVRPEARAAFREFLESEGQAFLIRVDEWLTAHEARAADGTTPSGIRLGAGLYYIED